MSASNLLSDSAGDIMLAFAADPGNNRQDVITYLRLHRGVWSQRELTLATVPEVYVDLAINGEHLVVVGYVAANPAVQNHEPSNQLFAIRSLDGGQTWSDPVPVSRTDQGLAYQPRIVADRTGTVHVVWIGGNGRGLDAGALLHATSTDGLHWAGAPSLLVSGLLLESPAAVDQCDVVHVLALRFENGGGRLVHVQFPPQGEASSEHLFPGWSGHEIAVMMDRDRLRFVWVGQMDERAQADTTHSILQVETLLSDVPIHVTRTTAQHK